jgi:hypothetical protein
VTAAADTKRKARGDELHGGGDTQVETEREGKMQGNEHAARERYHS